MIRYFIGIDILKQFLFGISWHMTSASICFGPLSIEIHPKSFKEHDHWVSFYNAFTEDW